MITKEQYETLSKYEKNLSTALHLGYARNLGQVAVCELDEVYKEIFNEQSKLKGGCPACVLSELKRLAVEFEKYVPSAPEEVNEEVPQVEPEKKQRKRKK